MLLDTHVRGNDRFYFKFNQANFSSNVHNKAILAKKRLTLQCTLLYVLALFYNKYKKPNFFEKKRAPSKLDSYHLIFSFKHPCIHPPTHTPHIRHSLRILISSRALIFPRDLSLSPFPSSAVNSRAPRSEKPRSPARSVAFFTPRAHFYNIIWIFFSLNIRTSTACSPLP